MNRIAIVGNSGSGKSTLGRRIGEQLGHAHLELDSVYHQADWTPLPIPEFQSRVDAFMDANLRWVIDGNYSAVQPRIWARADTVIWMSPGRVENMRSIIWRTVRRAVLRETLWNGNRESLNNFLRLHDPQRSVIAWSWAMYGDYQARYGGAMEDPEFQHLRFIRLTSRKGAADWLTEQH